MEMTVHLCHSRGRMAPDTSTRKPPINWPTVLFIAATTLAALLWPLYAWFAGVTTGQIVFAIAYYLATGLGITVGYHRLIAHQTFKAHPVAEAVLVVLGGAAWQGSALEWTLDHIQHHLHVDTDADPYNRRRGFWYAHIGWLIRRETLDHRRRIPPFLRNDRVVMLQHRYYVPLSVVTSLLIPFLLEGWGGLLLVGAVRIVALHHTTWFINSWAHTGTKRPYNPEVSAADNWLLALVAFGEGWHNYHHAFPSDYRNGVGALAWDPSKWLIWSLSKIGAAHDLKRMNPAVVWQRRVEATLAYRGPQRTRENLVDATRRALEKLARRSEARLAALSAATAGPRAAGAADLAELRRRISERADEWRRSRDRRALARARRIEDLIEQLTLYRDLLTRISSASAC
ncbi:MAG: fatty acid desaturase [Deltaproteobacteria bacterium]|nr:fatty acid desaturase [Deltaproteobacteria bacterium]